MCTSDPVEFKLCMVDIHVYIQLTRTPPDIHNASSDHCLYGREIIDYSGDNWLHCNNNRDNNNNPDYKKRELTLGFSWALFNKN